PRLPTKSRPTDGAAEEDFHDVGSMNLDSVLILLLIEKRRVRLRVRVRNLLPSRSQALGSWKALFRLFECIGTMNPRCATCSFAREASCGSWKAPFRLSACIGTMKPLTAWSPGFSRSKLSSRLKAGLQTNPDS